MHNCFKKEIAGIAYYERRLVARRRLWDLRHTNPEIAELFKLEMPPPPDAAAFVPELWEPEEVF